MAILSSTRTRPSCKHVSASNAAYSTGIEPSENLDFVTFRGGSNSLISNDRSTFASNAVDKCAGGDLDDFAVVNHLIQELAGGGNPVLPRRLEGLRKLFLDGGVSESPRFRSMEEERARVVSGQQRVVIA